LSQRCAASCLAAYGVIRAVRGLSIDALSWHRGGPYLAGEVILIASLYRLAELGGFVGGVFVPCASVSARVAG
jgi:hypothetical protein